MFTAHLLTLWIFFVHGRSYNNYLFIIISIYLLTNLLHHNLYESTKFTSNPKEFNKDLLRHFKTYKPNSMTYFIWSLLKYNLSRENKKRNVSSYIYKQRTPQSKKCTKNVFILRLSLSSRKKWIFFVYKSYVVNNKVISLSLIEFSFNLFKWKFPSSDLIGCNNYLIKFFIIDKELEYGDEDIVVKRFFFCILKNVANWF